MKRIFCCLLASVLLLMNLVSCDEEKGAEPRSGPTVDQSAWERAFSGEFFDNVTIRYYYDDADKDHVQVVKTDEANHRFYATNTSGMAGSDGFSSTTEYENYFYEKGGQSYLRSKATTTVQPSGEVTVKWTDEINEDAEAWKELDLTILEAMTLALGEPALSLSENFDLFTYNEETKVYEGTLTERIVREGHDDLVYHYDVTVCFEDGRISFLKYHSVLENNSPPPPVHAYYFTDYGTTKITLPEMPQE